MQQKLAAHLLFAGGAPVGKHCYKVLAMAETLNDCHLAIVASADFMHLFVYEIALPPNLCFSFA